MNNTSMISKDRLDFDPSIPEDERRFYQKAYPNVNFVRERKVHCTVCKMHIGTAPSNESIVRMHPILRVTHCKKCHEFYNSGEFSKGEDGSELYCRWCGQGGEVYCCSNCPFVFCKACIISNLSRGVVADIEQNENWSCFNCAPKMLWPLRAQHWALIKFIDKQKKAILNSNLSDSEIKTQMTKDRSLCCKIKKVGGYGSDSSDSDISLSRLKQKVGEKRSRKSSKDDSMRTISPVAAKKPKSNDEVVCTPDVMSMLEPECQLTVAPNAKPQAQPTASSPKIMSIPQTPKRPTPPPLVVRNTPVPPLRPSPNVPIIKKTIVGPRLPVGTPGDFTTPVYHTINGYRIDLNSAAQQDTVRLPNGKLIQVKRQGTGPQTVTTVQNAPNQQSPPTRVIHNATSATIAPISLASNAVPPVANVANMSPLPNPQILHSSGGHIIRAQLQTPRSISVQNPNIMPQFQQPSPQPQYQQITIRQPNQQIATIRYQGAPTQQMTSLLQNGTVQLLNGTSVTTSAGQMAAVRQVPTFVKQFFPNTPLGQSRTQLQNQIFNAMEICQHLMGKVQTLTNSNAYKTAKSLTDVKELYIHLSYLLTYAIGRFKGLQDSSLSDMRDLGFINDANSLENGQLAAEKQASDAEEDEISIVEPKTDTINLDSDNEDDVPPPAKPIVNLQQQEVKSTTETVISKDNTNQNQHPHPNPHQHQPQHQHLNINQNLNTLIAPVTLPDVPEELGTYDLLAGLLDVEITEGSGTIQPTPKKPRKKTTNKPNPTLLKQKEMQHRERLDYMKKTDAKLKMQVQIPLNKVEDIYEYAKPLVEGLKHEKVEMKTTDLLKPLREEEVKDDVPKKEEKKGLEKKLSVDSDKPGSSSENVIENDKSTPESKVDDKDESEEVVLVLVEDLDNSKEDEENKNGPEDNDGSVEIIEREEESQDSDQDVFHNELSRSLLKKRNINTDVAGVRLDLDADETNEKVKGNKLDEQVVFKIDEDEDEEGKGEEETEVLIDYENNTCVTRKSIKDPGACKQNHEVIDIDTDPLDNEGDKSLLVPIETQNIANDSDSSPGSSHSSHNIDFERILGRTEVA